MHPHPGIEKFVRSRWAMLTAGVVLVVSLALMGFEDPRQIHGWPPLGMSLRLPGWHMQARATRHTYSFVCQRNQWVTSAAIGFGSHAYLFKPAYNHGVHLEVAHFGFAFLPTTYHGGDYIVSPHAAFGIPFWFTATASGLLMIYGLYRRHRQPHTRAPDDKPPDEAGLSL